MFCSKCGTKTLESAEFCPKCGEGLVINSDIQPEKVNTVNPMNRSGNISMSVPKKKKGKMLLIILGVVAVIIILLAIIGSIGEKGEADRGESRQPSSSTEVSLSQTYINETEGISFKYPEAWKPLSKDRMNSLFGATEPPLVVLANEIPDLPKENSYVAVSKFISDQNRVDHLFIDDEKFAATFDSDVSIKETSLMELDGVPTRKIAYYEPETDLGYESYMYAVGLNLYRIDFVWKGKSVGNNQRFFDAIINSYMITSKG